VQAPGRGATGEDRPLGPISTSTLLSRELLWKEAFCHVFNLFRNFLSDVTGTRTVVFKIKYQDFYTKIFRRIWSNILKITA